MFRDCLNAVVIIVFYNRNELCDYACGQKKTEMHSAWEFSAHICMYQFFLVGMWVFLYLNVCVCVQFVPARTHSLHTTFFLRFAVLWTNFKIEVNDNDVNWLKFIENSLIPQTLFHIWDNWNEQPKLNKIDETRKKNLNN